MRRDVSEGLVATIVAGVLFTLGWVGADYVYHQCNADTAPATDLAQNVPTPAPPRSTLAQQVLRDHTGVWLTAITVIDGDTIDAELQFPPFRQENGPYRIRLTDATGKYDAWESHRYRQTVVITDEELEKGRKAEEALASLICRSAYCYLIPVPDANEPHGRPVGMLRLVQEDGTIVAAEDVMLKAGHDRNRDENGAVRHADIKTTQRYVHPDDADLGRYQDESF